MSRILTVLGVLALIAPTAAAQPSEGSAILLVPKLEAGARLSYMHASPHDREGNRDHTVDDRVD